MGEFFEPEPIEPLAEKPKVFTNEFITSVVKKSIASGDIDEKDRLTFVGVVDENGVQAIVAVSLVNKEIMKIKFNGVFEHQWTGDNKVGAKVIFSLK